MNRQTRLPFSIFVAVLVTGLLLYGCADDTTNSEPGTASILAETPIVPEATLATTTLTGPTSSTQAGETQSPTETRPPDTQSPNTQPPVSQPPVSQPPVSQPEATSASQPPTDQSPASQPTENQPPVSQSLETVPPETQPPETQPPETQPPDPNSCESRFLDARLPGSQPLASQPPATQPPATDTEVSFPRAPRINLDPLHKFDSGPLSMAVHPEDTISEVLYFALRDGRVMSLKLNSQNGNSQSVAETKIIIDLREEIIIANVFNELGLAGITFSPDGSLLYTYFVTTDRADLHQYNWTGYVHEWPVERGPDGVVEVYDPSRLVIAIPQPYSNHNGGDLAFGPDGMLYLGVGDGGGSGDPLEAGQNPQTLLGTILRINPEPNVSARSNPEAFRQANQGYCVPTDNPFAEGFHEDADGTQIEGAPEVWAYGLRNPWRLSFDRATGDLWIADVGQNRIEEITRLTAAEGGGRGANLGWSIYEGTSKFSADDPRELGEDHTLPIWQYEHGPGLCSVTGGYVYRGTALRGYEGVYIYADYCGRDIYGFKHGVAHQVIARLQPASNPVSFGQDNSGELYVLLHDRDQEELDGWVYKLVPS